MMVNGGLCAKRASQWEALQSLASRWASLVLMHLELQIVAMSMGKIFAGAPFLT
jgi:hypothetical protein